MTFIEFWTKIHELEKKYSTDMVKYSVEQGHYLTADAGWLILCKNDVKIADLHFYNGSSYTSEQYESVISNIENILSSETEV